MYNNSNHTNYTACWLVLPKSSYARERFARLSPLLRRVARRRSRLWGARGTATG